METAVMHFTPCTTTTTLASAKIARYIAEKTKADLIDSDMMADLCLPKHYEVIFVVNSPFGFCKFREQAVRIARSASQRIWVQNDYALKPRSQMKDIRFDERWTTIPDEGEYINWNQLTFYSRLWEQGLKVKKIDGLFYYGAYREDREESFNRYLKETLYPVQISTTAGEKFMMAGISGANIRFYKPFVSHVQLCSFRDTIYVEDSASHGQFHSLANRFYECLSAGIAIAVDEKTLGTFKKSGLIVHPNWIVSDSRQLKRFIERHEMYDIPSEQRRHWGTNHRALLDARFRELWG